MLFVRAACLVIALLVMAGCNRNTGNAVPERVTAATQIPVRSSVLVIPVAARIADLERLLNAEVPRRLVDIDREERACVPAERVTACIIPKLECKKGLKCRKVGCAAGLHDTRITPDISCRIVGKVDRGPIRLTGNGDVIDLSMPVSAVFSARDIGKVIKSETATAEAEVRARIRLRIEGDWKPVAAVQIDYDWTQKPGIEMFGRRFTFAGKADPQLRKIIRRIEADIPRHIERLHPREKLEAGWKLGFTEVELNRRKPPVWLRVTPQKLRYEGYRFTGGDVILDLAATANTETFVGNRPPSSPVTPLPPPASISGGEGFAFHLPVIADYAQLEPVLERALGKLSKRPIVLPAIGAVKPRFGNVTMYTAPGNRLAIGVEMSVDTPRKLVDVKGTVWLTGVPHNEPGSQRITVTDLRIDGRPKTPAFGVLLAVAQSETVMAELQGALSQDFAGDYARIIKAATKAISRRRVGDFVIKADIDNVINGAVMPVGQGLYMPVDVTGTGALTFDPEPRTAR